MGCYIEPRQRYTVLWIGDFPSTLWLLWLLWLSYVVLARGSDIADVNAMSGKEVLEDEQSQHQKADWQGRFELWGYIVRAWEEYGRLGWHEMTGSLERRAAVQKIWLSEMHISEASRIHLGMGNQRHGIRIIHKKGRRREEVSAQHKSTSDPDDGEQSPL